MDLILQQAKQYFVAKEYQKAIKLYKQHKGDIMPSKKAFVIDVVACSCYLLKDYDTANKLYDQAIRLNPNVTDFYISKAATLRNLQLQVECLQVLEKAQKMSKDPAIFYNLRILARNNTQIVAQTQLISEYESFNPNYDKYGGIVPSFLKHEPTRSDYILAREQEGLRFILDQVPKEVMKKEENEKHKDQDNKKEIYINEVVEDKQKKNEEGLYNQKDKIKKEIEMWKEYMNKVNQIIEFRSFQKKNYGIQYTQLSKQLFPIFKQLLQSHESLQTGIYLQLQKQQLRPQFHKIVRQICAHPQEAHTLLNAQLPDLTEMIIIKSEKQLHHYKNYASFKEAKSMLEKEIVRERIFKLIDRDQVDLHMLITEKNCFIYGNMHFIRNLQPTRSNKIIKDICEQLQQNYIKKKDKQKVKKNLDLGKILVNFYWFLCMRIILNGQQGINIKVYIQLRQAFNFIYQQLELPQQYKYSTQQLTHISLKIFQKYNKIHGALSHEFLCPQKYKIIRKNFESQKNYIDEIDEIFSTVLKKQIYLDALTKDSKNAAKEQKYFRQEFGLDGTALEDIIVENLIVFGYQLRIPGKAHQIIVRGFADLAVEGANTLNGKDSLFKNYYQFKHPPKNLLEKIWRKISS